MKPASEEESSNLEGRELKGALFSQGQCLEWANGWGYTPVNLQHLKEWILQVMKGAGSEWYNPMFTISNFLTLSCDWMKIRPISQEISSWQ